MAPDQFSYPKARESNTNPTHEQRHEPDWKNIPDCGRGITQFLWQEEILSHRAEIRENEIKYWNALDKKEWQQVEEKIQGKTKIKEFKILNIIIRVAFWNTKGMAHIAAREKLVHYLEKKESIFYS